MNPIEFEDLTPAEICLLKQCHLPKQVSIGAGARPHDDSAGTRIRASLLRALLLGQSNAPLSAKGLLLRGAWITGAIDLQGADTLRDIRLENCVLDTAINLENASMRGLHLTNCKMQNVSADNSAFSGSFQISDGSDVEGTISLTDACIAGEFQVCDVTITPAGPDAIFARSLRVEGSVFLGNHPDPRGRTCLIARGRLFFASARVANDFFAAHVTIELPAAKQFSSESEKEDNKDTALTLARAQIGGLLLLLKNSIKLLEAGETERLPMINLAAANVGRLKDDPTEGDYRIRLDGFRYNDFSRGAETDVEARLKWLDRRPDKMQFLSQPYEQLARVLTSLGHRRDAQLVLMRKEHLLRAENRQLASADSPLRSVGMWVVDTGLNRMIGYGYRPGRAVVIAAVLIAALSVFYHQVWDAGDFAPNAAPILVSDGWIDATQTHAGNPAVFWSAPGQAGQDYETFSPVAYAADLVIPLIALGQDEAWAPSTSRSPLGRIGWWLRWVAKSLGWIVTALAAAALTGIIRKE